VRVASLVLGFLDAILDESFDEIEETLPIADLLELVV
jgi:hypothetical protein